MKRWWHAWIALTSARELGTSLAWFRIAVGLVLMYSVLSLMAADLVDVMWVDAADGGMLQLSADHWLVRLLGGYTPTVGWLLAWSTLGLGAATAAGIGGRVTIFAALAVYDAATSGHSTLTGGYDSLIVDALWLLVLADATATWSLDCRRRTGRWTSDRLVAAWPRYLLIFQLVVVYTTTGLHKLSAVWVPGGSSSALYWVFQEPTWRRFDMSWTAHVYWLTQLATAVTWWWEISAPLLLVVYWLRWTRDRGGRLRRLVLRYDPRLLWAAIGIALHLSILITLNVGPFSPISLSYYLCLIAPPAVAAATTHGASGVYSTPSGKSPN